NMERGRRMEGQCMEREPHPSAEGDEKHAPVQGRHEPEGGEGVLRLAAGGRAEGAEAGGEVLPGSHLPADFGGCGGDDGRSVFRGSAAGAGAATVMVDGGLV